MDLHILTVQEMIQAVMEQHLLSVTIARGLDIYVTSADMGRRQLHGAEFICDRCHSSTKTSQMPYCFSCRRYAPEGGRTGSLYGNCDNCGTQSTYSYNGDATISSTRCTLDTGGYGWLSQPCIHGLNNRGSHCEHGKSFEHSIF